MNRNLDQIKLINELQKAGIKHNSADIVAITKLSSGKIVFLESGNPKAGLRHITTRHGQDFANRGIAENDIVNAVMTAIIRGKVAGRQGSTRTIYTVFFGGKIQYISVEIGSNGYIVSANPTPRKLILKLTQRKLS